MKRKIVLLIVCLTLILSVIMPIQQIFADDDIAYYKSVDELEGKRIGVMTGANSDTDARSSIKDCKLVYFNSTDEIALALDNGSIDAYVLDEPIAVSLLANHTNQTIIQTLKKSDYAFVFKKDNSEASKLCSQFNDFLRVSRNNGLIDYLKSKWTGKYEDVKTIDLSEVEDGENGILTFATASDAGAPFAYFKDGEYIGYDIDLAVEFCKANGYGIKIINYSFYDLMRTVKNGEADFAAGCITVTDERKAEYLFSDANYNGGVVAVGIKSEKASTVSIDDLKCVSVGIWNGSMFDKVAEENIEDCVLSYYNGFVDLAAALDDGKIDCYIADEPVAKYIISNHTRQKIAVRLTDDMYGLMFKKDDAKGTELCNKMNNFLLKSEENGFMRYLENKWIYGSEENRNCDYSDMTEGENGTLIYATCTDVGAPFCYLKDGVIVGYEIELAVEFCREYGYGIQVKNYASSGILNSVGSGSADFGGACVIISEERKESMLFSNPHYEGGMVVVMLDDETESGIESFFGSIIESFNKTFIRENRWQLFINGIFSTMIITVISLVCGGIIGFALFLACRKGGKIVNGITKFCFMIIQRMPVIVLLMILYYAILGQFLHDGMAVSIVCFTLTFAASFFGILKSGVGAVDQSQYEAAYSLGFSQTGTFIHVILPQAAQHFLPLLKAEVVTHIKATAVVGYIAVQDLTRVSDIIRSRTYEAFFPLIATAIIYFALEALLIFAVSRIEIKVNRRGRKAKNILKGIDTECKSN